MKKPRTPRWRGYWAGLGLFLLACGGSDGPLQSQEPEGEQIALDIQTRVEEDIAWGESLLGRNISWRMNSSRRLARSISVIGTFRITLVNTEPAADLEVAVLVRLLGGDGVWHVPETPVSRLLIPAGDSLQVRENFIVEVEDRKTANELARIVFSFNN
ncbi:MAG: hypothetical protein GKR89_05500 [Candidatus Latescibacteria bacterium]|nr:hypothetical protein [Candidatus Latescibacterota bacterium]